MVPPLKFEQNYSKKKIKTLKKKNCVFFSSPFTFVFPFFFLFPSFLCFLLLFSGFLFCFLYFYLDVIEIIICKLFMIISSMWSLTSCKIPITWIFFKFFIRPTYFCWKSRNWKKEIRIFFWKWNKKKKERKTKKDKEKEKKNEKKTTEEDTKKNFWFKRKRS